MQRACQPGPLVLGWPDRTGFYEEAVMTVGHILSQKGSAVVTAKPDDTVHAVEEASHQPQGGSGGGA